ncbi:MAG TPA: tripartite tricarboxylate transporter substrate binding protein, partial [Salinarimonas sp.]|nr:tripartite tricarboxylate transporter substrate binding protein [Salinarimonas sp.]
QMIIPFDAGGNTDLMARALQEEMAKALGQSLVPINKPGAAATLGTGELARAKPDGYTLGMVPIGPLALQPNMRKLPYSLESFDYICQTYDVPMFLMVPQDSRFKSAADVVSFAKDNPNAFLYGSSGPGTMPHIATAAFLRAAGVGGTHVPFRGSGEMAQALLGGTIMAFSDAPSLAAANNLRILATYSSKREPTHPDVPTMRELGYDFTGSVWGGIIAPKGLPAPVRTKLEEACRAAASSDGYKQAAARLNSPALYKTGPEFKAFVEAQSKALGDVIRAAGLEAK